MLKQYPFRSAYTLLELIFVIVILGIVSSIGAELIAKVYENYIIQRAHHRAELKTELAALQIANRLRYAIPGTLYRIKNDDSLESTLLSLSAGADTYKGLQWVGYDGDSFEAVSTNTNQPGWSGFADVEDAATDINHIKTQGSNLTLANTIIGNLSPTVGKSITNAFVYFPNENVPSAVNGFAGDIISLAAPAAGTRTIHEHYKLAWSSYALYVDNNDDLLLYYDFPATLAANKDNGTNQLLLKNVTTFKFKVTGRTIRFKLCVQEEIGEDYNITACKEKAVF